MPAETIARHAKEKNIEKTSAFHPRKLLPFLWIVLPILLYVFYRFVRLYLSYHLSHDATAQPMDESGGS